MLSLILTIALDLGAPAVQMSPDYYLTCVERYPNDSAKFWKCAVDMDTATRAAITPLQWKALAACTAFIDAAKEHKATLPKEFTFQIDGQQATCRPS